MSIRATRSFRRAAGGCLALFLTGVIAPVQAQTRPEQDLPVIQGTFTQVFAPDSMAIGMAALSPDGRWVVFSGWSEIEASDLWIISTAGGEPFPILESDPNESDGVVWFPSGDRIAFRYGHFIASLGIDPSTGRPVGQPERVTLEASSAYFDISPDGKWIAYTPLDAQGNRVIRVVPSNGGIARTLVEADITRPAWAPDGRSIYYVLSRVDSPEETLMRIEVEDGARAEGAEPEEVLTHMGHIGTGTYPGAGYVWMGGFGTPESPRVAVTTLEGQWLAQVELEKGMRVRGFSSDGRTLLAEVHGRAAPLRVLPVAGGPPRTLQSTESRALAWTPDGERVLLETALDGTERLFLASVSGGSMGEVRLPEPQANFGVAAMHYPLEHRPDPVLSADGRYLVYAVDGDEPGTATLEILDMETGTSTTLTSEYPVPGWDMPGRVLGPGGAVNRDEDEFFYWEKDGGKMVLMAGKPGGDTRVIRGFDDVEESIAVAVWGDRVAFVRREDGKASVQLGEVGGEESRTILTVDGFLDVMAWSPDGRWLAASYWPEDAWDARVMLVEVSSDGTVRGEPRVLGPPATSWWGNQWLPDSSGFLTAGTEGDVWLIPVDPMAEPAPISTEEEGEISDFVLSPDGTQIAYAPWIPQGNSLWLIDLGDALSRASR